jgi:hypothetical protein
LLWKQAEQATLSPSYVSLKHDYARKIVSILLHAGD